MQGREGKTHVQGVPRREESVPTEALDPGRRPLGGGVGAASPSSPRVMRGGATSQAAEGKGDEGKGSCRGEEGRTCMDH